MGPIAFCPDVFMWPWLRESRPNEIHAHCASFRLIIEAEQPVLSIVESVVYADLILFPVVRGGSGE